MKHLVRILSVLLVLCLLAGASVSVAAIETELAAVALDQDVPDEVHTQVSFSDGSAQDFAAAPDIEEIDDSAYRETIESYEVFFHDRSVLDVTFTEFYSIDFVLPTTTKRVFLAGLTAQNVEETQQKIINSYSNIGYMLSLEDLSFIDSEKTYKDQNDDNLCWAASCSNILTYTGWGAKAGFESEDDIFDAYVSAFTDNGNNAEYGLGWFFNGVDTFAKLADGVAQVKNYGSSGNYLPDYAYDRVTDHVEIYDDYTYLQGAIEALRQGCGVALGVETFINNSHVGGHEVTMWGAVTDEAYTPDDLAYYDMLFITDSDSDNRNANYTDRRQAKNELDLYKLSSFTRPIYDEASNTLSYYDGLNTCALFDYDYLIPYSDEVEKETDEQATKNKTTTTDVAIKDVYLSDSANGEPTDRFMLGDTVYIRPVITNVGDYVFTASSHTLTATISGTNWSAQRNFTSRMNPSSFINSILFSAGGLKRGDYTLTVQFDADRRVQEAYYYNNTYTVDFSVVTDPAKYMAGDADDDWEITVLDATMIQKTLAVLISDEDGRIAERGDLYGSGLNILSATAIQKYIAALDVNVDNIGEIKEYHKGE